MNPPTHYEVLGLTLSATTEEIGNRADELLRLYGSDTQQGSMTRLIDEAKRVLISSALRSIYDSGLNAEHTSPIASKIVHPTNSPPVPTPTLEPELTVPVPIPHDPDRTVTLPDNMPNPVSDLPNDAKIAHELARRGVSQDEVRRLMEMGKPVPSAKGKGRPAPISIADMIPESKPYVPKPTIALPAFRESTTAERMEADRLLTSANIARRRGQFQQAETDCRAALMLVPKDGAALEVYGDILQAIGKVDDALYAYGRAKEADPKRTLAEKKYAELMLLQNREIEMLREEFVPRNPTIAVLISSLFPGTGQIYNGETLKGLLLMVSIGACGYLLGWTPYGFHKGQSNLGGPIIAITLFTGALYIFGVIDAFRGAQRGRKMNSGWDV